VDKDSEIAVEEDALKIAVGPNNFHLIFTIYFNYLFLWFILYVNILYTNVFIIILKSSTIILTFEAILSCWKTTIYALTMKLFKFHFFKFQKLNISFYRFFFIKKTRVIEVGMSYG